MKRKITEFISIEALKHLKYIPLSIAKIKNWYPFLLNYIGLRNDKIKTYKFRDGIKIKTAESVDTATIAVVFIKKDYGKIPNNSTIIDIGGNIGTFSIYAIKNSKKSKVYAFEPMPNNFKLLKKNVKLNKMEKRIIPFKLGVGGKTEKRTLFFGKGSPYNSLYGGKDKSNSLDINVISLKDIFEKNKIEKCDLLKSDCEGAEFEIIYNTPDKYLKKIKEIRLEYHNQEDKKNTGKALVKYLKSKGFKLIHLQKDSPRSGNAWLRQI